MEYYQKYLQEKALDHKTITTYLNVLSRFFEWYKVTYNEKYDAQNVVPITLTEYLSYLKNERAAASTIQLSTVVLKNYFKILLEGGLIKADPAKNLKVIKMSRRAPRWLNRNQQHAFRRELERRTVSKGSCRDECIGKVLIGTGIRTFEAAAIQLVDLELSDRKGLLKVIGKGNKYRTVPLNQEVRSILRKWLQERANHKFSDSKYLFVTERQEKMSERQISRIIYEVLDDAALKAAGFTTHSLRHTCGKELAKKHPESLVAEILGHSDINSTRIYTAYSQDELEHAMESISWE